MLDNDMTTNDMTGSHAGCPGGTGYGTSAARGRTGARHLVVALLCIALGTALPGGLPTSARAEATQLGGDYPDAQCTSPMRPFAGDKAWEWDLYRQKMGAYRACVDAYVRRARADIEIIQGKIDKAVREYNREVTMP
ncbi:hypothetical protein [Nitratidesulfovibrio sp. 1201_IL3209]|uniref:hypothetical protein n=1 Tax=Nitratidesulfovibrio sp. 1201_IL3209 TaxID=3084053 RepID=UPI002FD926F1